MAANSQQQEAAAAAERAKILEGVDFIETEEDAEAVESAVVRIQSTFRGKKIRSKLNQNNNNNNNNQSEQQKQQAKDKTEPSTAKVSADELSKKVANMEVNDKADKQQAATNLPEDEAQRAATKIQAGFKGYKTRKELEGIIASGQPATAAGQEEQQQEAAAKS